MPATVKPAEHPDPVPFQHAKRDQTDREGGQHVAEGDRQQQDDGQHQADGADDPFGAAADKERQAGFQQPFGAGDQRASRGRSWRRNPRATSSGWR